MRRRQLVATATAGALTSVLATFSVAAAALVAPPAPRPAPQDSSLVGGVPAVAGAWKPRKVPLIIAHRGASAYRPEHTLAAYRLAMAMGADYVETDLVVTRDGQLVARHEHELSLTTDVADHPEFAGRRATRTVEGTISTGWFTEDFTLAELKTLRAKTRRPAGGRPSGSMGRPAVVVPPGAPPPAPPSTVPAQETIVTLQEIVDLVQRGSRTAGRQVGLYVELKLPGYFRSLGLAPEPRLAEVLQRNGLAKRTAPVFVESFEAESLRTLHKLVEVPLIQLLWEGTSAAVGSTAVGLNDVRSYASGIGLNRNALQQLVAGPGAPPGVGNQRDLVRLAHDNGLEVHVFTFANNRLGGPVRATAYRADDPPAIANALAEYRAYFGLGVDGVFTDNPDVAVRARR